ncbi:MAG: dihydroorotase [Candidatus Cyclobacteriaceae bacterium M3_2C_046]
MNILIKSAEVVDKRSPWDGQKMNIYIENGVIKQISQQELEADQVLDADGLKVSVGWFDMWSHFADPGFEHKEDLDSGSQVAAAGGFTGVALIPNTDPVVQNKNLVSYLKSRNNNQLTQLFPMAAITLDTHGESITEMIDLHKAGAVAFTDGIKPVWNTDILLKTLLYLKKFNGLLIHKPQDRWLNLFGNMHEGINSTMLGLKGMPRLSEEIIIERDLHLLEYTGGKIHFSHISSAKSVELIRQARAVGLAVTCDVAAHQLVFDDGYLNDFDTNYKVNPPFRQQEDIDALIRGLADGTIDCIVSSHHPQDEESKKLEFDLAEFGLIGLQTVFPVINQLSAQLDLRLLIEKITVNPRNILNLDQPRLETEQPACLTLFDPEASWVLDNNTNKSKSVNSPYWQKLLKGSVVATINNNQVFTQELQSLS